MYCTIGKVYIQIIYNSYQHLFKPNKTKNVVADCIISSTDNMLPNSMMNEHVRKGHIISFWMGLTVMHTIFAFYEIINFIFSASNPAIGNAVQ